MVASPRGALRRGVRRVGHQRAGSARAARPGRLERLRARARATRLGGAIHTVADYTLPGFTHELLELLASALHRLRRLRRARRRSSAGAASSTSTPSCRPRRRSRTGRPCSSTPRSRRTSRSSTASPSGDGAAWQRQFDEFMANADLELRRPRDRAVVGGGARPRPADAAAPRPPRPPRVRGARALDLPRLDRPRPSGRRRRTGCSRPGCCTRASARRARSSGFMTQVIACALQLGGMPVPVRRRREARRRARGDRARRGRRAAHRGRRRAVLVTDGGATGVALAGGETVEAARAVIAGVTPTQLYGRLLGDGDAPPEVTRRPRAAIRYGRAGMQIHLALDEPPRWRGGDAERLAGTAIVHVTPGLDGVSRAVNEADRGLLPAEATIVVGQPCAVDPSRAPEGKSILWLQLQELPAGAVQGRRRGRARRRRRDVDRGAPRGVRRPDRRRGSASRSRTSAPRP